MKPHPSDNLRRVHGILAGYSSKSVWLSSESGAAKKFKDKPPRLPNQPTLHLNIHLVSSIPFKTHSLVGVLGSCPSMRNRTPKAGYRGRSFLHVSALFCGASLAAKISLTLATALSLLSFPCASFSACRASHLFTPPSTTFHLLHTCPLRRLSPSPPSDLPLTSPSLSPHLHITSLSSLLTFPSAPVYHPAPPPPITFLLHHLFFSCFLLPSITHLLPSSSIAFAVCCI